MKANVVVAAFAAALACGTAFLGVRIRSQGRELDAFRRELDSRGAAQVGAERMGMAELATALASASRAPLPREERAPSPAEPDKSAGSTLPVTPHLSLAEVQARLATVFAKEPLDVGWAQERTRALTTRVQAVLPPLSVLTSVECRSSLCRIETAHETAESARAFMGGALENVDTKLTTGASVTTPQGRDQRGRAIIVQFVAGEGQDLPRVDEM